uniref:Uncharacterized protein n=1 Tax=Pyxicephalus adspersus TaxID=30357 RepID=A0AAV3AS64_PYXAD|nr:TPA: hypothetical protein GDO54_001880 [Pyxicephalus adspersus]
MQIRHLYKRREPSTGEFHQKSFRFWLVESHYGILYFSRTPIVSHVNMINQSRATHRDLNNIRCTLLKLSPIWNEQLLESDTIITVLWKTMKKHNTTRKAHC